ncbi:MAG: YgjP-like metallopeptidase domain-containing protein [Clostridia bacterium]
MKIIIKRTRRKSITLKLLDCDLAEVSAPLKMKTEAIEDFVKKHKLWLDKCSKQKQIQNLKIDEILCGNCLQIFGEKAYCHQDCNEILFNNLKENSIRINTKVLKQFRVLAENNLERLFNESIIKTTLKNSKLKLYCLRRSWGSCNSKKQIMLNVKLFMLPKDLIQYVIYHEISHLKHMNHSTIFWKSVECFVPDYKERRKQLKEYSYVLDPKIKF